MITGGPIRRRRLAGAAGALVLVALALAAGCATGRSVADLVELPQDPAYYQALPAAPHWRVKPRHQAWLAQQFLRRYFAVWQGRRPRLIREQVRAMAGGLEREPGLGPNLRPHGSAWLERLWARADLAAYPGPPQPAITTAPCHLRVLPSRQPDFEPSGTGGDYPFDRLQQTSLPPNLPLVVHHRSADGGWLLVDSSWAWGWLPARDAALVDAGQIQRWSGGEFLVVTRDHTPVRAAAGGRFLFYAPLGALLPLAGGGPGPWPVLAAVADADGAARLVPALVERAAAARFPLALTADNLARLAGRLAGGAYGWGGMYGLRDCSATTKDLMVPFGLWLERNSADQARGGARRYDLDRLSPADKRRVILSEGVPFLTLLYLPGHVMLYIGPYQGRPLVFHNMWGLRVRRGCCRGEGRLVIGRAVVTTLTPGAERWDLVRPEGLIINRVKTMVLLAPPAAVELD